MVGSTFQKSMCISRITLACVIQWGLAKKKVLSGLEITNGSQRPSTQMRNGKKAVRPRVMEDSDDDDEEGEDGNEQEQQADDDT